MPHSFLSLSFLRFYLFKREGERERAQKWGSSRGMGEREAGFPLNRDPDAGLDPRTLGS